MGSKSKSSVRLLEDLVLVPLHLERVEAAVVAALDAGRLLEGLAPAHSLILVKHVVSRLSLLQSVLREVPLVGPS